MSALLTIMLLSNPEPVTGDAAFSYRIESAAQVRGMELAGWGSAVLDCGHLGDTAWIHVGGQWYETLVVDCVAAHDRDWFTDKGRAVDLPWELWRQANLPLMPVPAVVTWTEPIGGVR